MLLLILRVNVLFHGNTLQILCQRFSQGSEALKRGLSSKKRTSVAYSYKFVSPFVVLFNTFSSRRVLAKMPEAEAILIVSSCLIVSGRVI